MSKATLTEGSIKHAPKLTVSKAGTLPPPKPTKKKMSTTNELWLPVAGHLVRLDLDMEVIE